MEKLCVFCGERPKSKSNEHVIPQWLIELTGNPKRIAFFGYKEWLNPNSNKRTFSFDSLKFPSCTSCNQRFSTLEASARLVISKILSEKSISAIDFNSLLDWLDKVRVGLWLGYQYLDRNPASITTRFHIMKRIGAHDRMLAIFKTDGLDKQLNVTGCGLPSFCYTPSCFSLCINNFVIFNISFDFLFSRRIGFPYPSESFLVEDDSISDEPLPAYKFTCGRNRLMLPLLRKRLRIKTTELYQPMYPHFMNDSKLKELYKTKYVIDNSISFEKGIGKVFVQNEKFFGEYPTNPSGLWIPKNTYSFVGLLFDIQLLVLEWQTYIDSLSPSPKMLSKEWKKHIHKTRQFRKKFNNNLMDFLNSKKSKYPLAPP